MTAQSSCSRRRSPSCPRRRSPRTSAAKRQLEAGRPVMMEEQKAAEAPRAEEEAKQLKSDESEEDDEGSQHEQATGARPCDGFLNVGKADAMKEHAAQQDGAAEAMELYCRESTAEADAATARLTRHRVDQETERCSNSQDP